MRWIASGFVELRACMSVAARGVLRGHSYLVRLVFPLTALVLASCSSSLAQTSAPVPAATPAVTATPTSTPAPTCRAVQMTITTTSRGVAAGHSAVEFDVRNATAQACSLDGYPTVQLLDASQQPLTVTVTVTQSASAYVYNLTPPQLVTVVPGAQAYFLVQLFDVPAPGSSSCPTSAGVRLALPGNASSMVLALRLEPCQGQIYVSPIEAH